MLFSTPWVVCVLLHVFVLLVVLSVACCLMCAPLIICLFIVCCAFQDYQIWCSSSSLYCCCCCRCCFVCLCVCCSWVHIPAMNLTMISRINPNWKKNGISTDTYRKTSGIYVWEITIQKLTMVYYKGQRRFSYPTSTCPDINET